MEVTAACVTLETIDEGHVVTVYSDSSYLLNCMRRGWYEKWRENGWLNHLGEPVANRELWERLLEATRRHREVRWRKVKGHSKTGGAHKSGNDRADELAVTAKKEASGAGPPDLELRGSTSWSSTLVEASSRSPLPAPDHRPLVSGVMQ
jgi:ribonuclease HI